MYRKDTKSMQVNFRNQNNYQYIFRIVAGSIPFALQISSTIDGFDIIISSCISPVFLSMMQKTCSPVHILHLRTGS